MNAKEEVWSFVQETDELIRKFDPDRFTPWGASAPYVWRYLPRHIQDATRSRNAAISAARSTVKLSSLRALYTEESGIGWLSEQLENLARRSLWVAGGSASLRDSFEDWYPGFLAALNAPRLRYGVITELFGCAPAGGVRLAPVQDALFRFPGERVKQWIERGTIESALRRARIETLLAPNMPGFFRSDFDTPDAVFVSIVSYPKTAASLRRFGTAHPPNLYDWVEAAQLVLGRRIGMGSWLDFEVSPFPREDSSYFEARETRRHWDKPATELSVPLNREIRRAASIVRRFRDQGYAEESSALPYAYRRLQALLRGADASWFDEVLAVVSALESLMTDHASGRRGGPGRSQLAQRLVWLSALDDTNGGRLNQRFHRLYQARNSLIHGGDFSTRTFRMVMDALEVRVEREPGMPEHHIGSAEWQSWNQEGRPRLMELLRWALLVCLRLETTDLAAAVGWPFKGARAIDLDMALGRRSGDWHRPLKGLRSPLASG